MIFIISLFCAFLFFFSLFFLLGHALKKKQVVSERLQQYADYLDVKETAEEQISTGQKLRLAFRKRMRRVGGRKTASKLDLMMHRAGLPLLGFEMVVISFGVSILAFLMVLLVTGEGGAALLFALLAFLFQWGYVKYRIDKRLKAFLYQMADCLTLISNSLRAGFSFLQTIEIISKEMKPPVSTEFARVLRETNLGKPLDRALTEMDGRVGSPDFSLIVTAVLIQQQVGGNLADIIDIIRDTILDRIRLRGEIKTLTAQGRMAGMILAALPIAMGLFMYIMSPEYMRPLLTTRIGQIAIGVALVMEVIGFFIIHKIVDIKV